MILQIASYALDRDMSETDALVYWMGSDRDTFVAEEQGHVVGTYFLRANQAGGGAHVANCGYMTDQVAAGRGIARRMCEHSLEHARSRGYRAMQFNFIVSTNERAVGLWKALGFEVLGRLPRLLPSDPRLRRCARHVPLVADRMSMTRPPHWIAISKT